MPDARQKSVFFADQSLKDTFEELKDGKHEEKELYLQINKAISELEKNPSAGTKIPKANRPKIYLNKYGANNLWKYDLRDGWRIIYYLKGNSVEILAIILEWMDHEAYERRFGYTER